MGLELHQNQVLQWILGPPPILGISSRRCISFFLIHPWLEPQYMVVQQRGSVELEFAPESSALVDSGITSRLGISWLAFQLYPIPT